MAILLKFQAPIHHLPQPQSTAARRRQRRSHLPIVKSAIDRYLIQSGSIIPILTKDAVSAMEFQGYRLLDVRPEWEREKARIPGSLYVPLFVEDKDNSPLTLLKKWVHFGYIGLWTGQCFTTINPSFMHQVETLVPGKDSKLLVACGEGLRSMKAAAKLHEEGYENLGWLVGGFNRAKDGDFPVVEGVEKLQYASVGGVSYYLLKLLLILQALTGMKF